MTECYPNDSALLALSQDEATGVEYIPTGKSPYHLEFRRMLHRLLRACERANDLRVYQVGDVSIGVRPGRARLLNAPLDFAGATGIALDTNASTYVWLDANGEVQTDTSAFPSDRTTFVPLAEIVTNASVIESITDLRGEAFLSVPNLETLNVSASAAEINQALDDVSENVTAFALSHMTGGGFNSADSFHRHLRTRQDVDGEAIYEFINDSADANANMALEFSLVQRLPADTFLLVNLDNGFFQQRYDGASYNLLGTVQPQYKHAGALNASVNDALLGAVPAAGVVTDVILSVGENIVSDDSDDGVRATVKVNGTALTTTDPSMTDSEGAGFASTAQGDGTSAVLKTDGTEQVQRGDLLTVDLIRTANGTITSEAEDIVVLVVIRVNGPE
ncbi:MAG: hypothetical protein ACODAQ_04325 [Phycisphaeraceae bacterium]